ncbi:kinase-like domain-containing protein, partial [Coprinopsis sp. MPI-PUGE-AT-0042]
LLDIDALMHFRSIFLQGLLQVAETTGRVPGALVHNDAVIVESATAITSGAFGDIWRGVLYGQPVAMKVLRTTKRPDDILRSHSREAIVWSRLRHPNVLPFYGIYCWTPHPSTPQRMALLSPWLEAGNIVGYLRHHADVDKESMVLDIAQGLHYLHSFQPAIVHGNLKGNNILINSAGRTCIADFGLSKLINGSSSGPSGGLYGRELYTAPELLFWEHDQGDRAESGPSHPPSATIESDVYAFGCVCYEIFIGKPRFFDLPIMARLLSVRNNTKCPKPSHMSNTLWKNVKACWSTLPQERPTMAHFVQSLVLAQENNNKSVAGDGFCDTKSKVHCHPNPHAPFNFLPLRSKCRHTSVYPFHLLCKVTVQAADSFSTANTITAVGPSTVHSPTSTVVPPTYLMIPQPTLVVTTTPNFSFNQGDIIIAVMGPTGTGKSTFINDVMGTPVAAVGHGVSSCTSNIGVYGCEHIAFSNRRVFLVDTPGFGVGTSDERHWKALLDGFSKRTYSREISLSAVLYFMSIGEVRLSGRDLGNINVFQKLCGHAAFKNVAVITTGWEEVGEVAAAEREKSLKTEFLKEFLDGGGRCQRYRRTNSMMRNAWDIVDMFDGDKRPLLIQDEMVNKRLSLWRTSAFKAISKLRSLLRSIRVEGQGPSRGM